MLEAKPPTPLRPELQEQVERMLKDGYATHVIAYRMRKFGKVSVAQVKAVRHLLRAQEGPGRPLAMLGEPEEVHTRSGIPRRTTQPGDI